MPVKEDLAEMFVSQELGAIMAGILLLVVIIAGYYVRKWLQSIEETRKAVFGSNANEGLKSRVNALEDHRLEDRRDLDKVGVKVDHNHAELVKIINTLTDDISTKSEETAKALGEILGYLKGRAEAEKAERNRRSTD